MEANHAPQELPPLPPGMTRTAALVPVDQYAQLCVTTRRLGIDPAELVGSLIEARARELGIVRGAE
jgi:hypothetical protein